MGNHLYNTRLGKVSWFVKRFGMKELFMKPFRMVFAPVIIQGLPKRKFMLEGKEYDLFYHRYNVTWCGERVVEVPYFASLIENSRKKRILEVGNVLSHYYPSRWDVLDKFEQGKGIINKDILSFKPEEKYDLVVSISTLEHVGFDDSLEGFKSSLEKIEKSIKSILDNCLNKGGALVFSIPVGYNPEMDKFVFENRMKFERKLFLKRKKKLDWKEVREEEARVCKYGSPLSYGNCAAILTIRK